VRHLSHIERETLKISEVMQPSPQGAGRATGRLLLDEGVDLLAADASRLKRGTPVYVHVDADMDQVQRQMALKHIKLLPVIDGDEVVGLVDLVDLVTLQSQDGSGTEDLLGRPA
jgi:CBS domain-containing protein